MSYREKIAYFVLLCSQYLKNGYLLNLVGACAWLIVATAVKMPVSGTHSIVGAIIGFALVGKGPAGVNWLKLGLIGEYHHLDFLLSRHLKSQLQTN